MKRNPCSSLLLLVLYNFPLCRSFRGPRQLVRELKISCLKREAMPRTELQHRPLQHPNQGGPGDRLAGHVAEIIQIFAHTALQTIG